ncbi:MAG: lipopolysaccharide transport system permease protein [Anaerolineaceae bacterium]|nr:MAG: lipopolysaccharide transport system permease protein [Anaerolineaceae bacterium]
MAKTAISKPEPGTVVLRPSRGWTALNLRDLWLYRELVFFMTWRDLKVRYKQTLLGVSWAVLNPFLQMVVFSIFFGELAKVSSDGLPYPIFAYTALLPWTLFANALNNASRSLVSHQNMVTKIYFPRLLLPLASVMAGVVDFLLAFLVLIGMMIYYNATGATHLTLNWAMLTLPLFLLLALVTALGVALWLSALYVKYRDVNYIIPFLAEVWKFVSPVVYSTSMVPAKWQFVYALNPMAGVVNGFRWALLGTQTAPDLRLAISAAMAVIVLVSGLFYFRSMEKTFADTI